jgi:hypothetical protein
MAAVVIKKLEVNAGMPEFLANVNSAAAVPIVN